MTAQEQVKQAWDLTDKLTIASRDLVLALYSGKTGSAEVELTNANGPNYMFQLKTVKIEAADHGHGKPKPKKKKKVK